jgi:hypothetical protein
MNNDELLSDNGNHLLSDEHLQRPAPPPVRHHRDLLLSDDSDHIRRPHPMPYSATADALRWRPDHLLDLIKSTKK